MFAKLKGVIESINENEVIIDVNGVGYLTICSNATINNLKVLEPASLYISTFVREDAITLFGFWSIKEKEWFLLLNQVSGVSGKTAISLLSNLSMVDLSVAIKNEQEKILQRVSGIGQKLAARIILELKNSKKLNAILDLGSENDNASGSKTLYSNANIKEAETALETLGYKKQDIWKVLDILSKEQDSFSSLETSGLIKLALQRLR
jgi:Holliday junction DNA helicase RuvA